MLCEVCRDGHNIHRCGGCGALLCSAHRWSTGRETDGYFCVNGCTPVLPVVAAPVAILGRLRRGEWPSLAAPVPSEGGRKVYP